MSLLKILKGTHRRNIGRLLFGSPNGFSDLGIATISALLHFELAQTGSDENIKPSFESRPGVEYKLWEDRIQTRRLSWLQVPEGDSKLLWPERARDTATLRCWDLP